jgi:hypothetical protein
MIDCTGRIFDSDSASEKRWLCSVILGFAMLVGCDLRPEAVTESSKVPASPAAQLEPGIDIGLDRHALEPEAIKPRSKEDPVEVRLSILRENAIVGEALELVVVLSVAPGYEISSRDALTPKIPTILELGLPPGFIAMDEWESPTPVRSFNSEGASVYLGEAKFRRKIHILSDTEPGDYVLACSVSYQACNSRQCLRPMKAMLGVRVSVTH